MAELKIDPSTYLRLSGPRRLNTSFLSRADKGGTFEKTGFGIEPDRALIAREFNDFQQSNRDLLYVISKSETAQDLLEKKTIRSRDDLKQVLAEAAASQLEGDAKTYLTEKKLAEDSTLSAMLLLNTGNLRDIVNKDADVAKQLTWSSVDVMEDAFSKLASKAAAVFDAGHALNDEEFFKANPKAAIYVLQDSAAQSYYQDQDNGSERAAAFKEQIQESSNQDLLNNFLADYVSSSVGSATFSDSYFTENNSRIRLAEFIAAKDFTDETPTAAQYLKQNPQLGFGNIGIGDHFNYDQFVQDVTAKQAEQKNVPDSPLKFEFLRKNIGLSRLALQDQAFAEALNKPEAKKDLGLLLGTNKNFPEFSVDQLERHFSSHYQEKNVISFVV